MMPKEILPFKSQSTSDNFLVEFVEQPAFDQFRFRKSDNPNVSMRGASKISSVPAIRIAGPKGLKLVVIQLVTNDEPYWPHPYALIGKNCFNGVYFRNTNKTNKILKLNQIGIQYLTPDKHNRQLKFRKMNNLDPFRTGFSTAHFNRNDFFQVRMCVTVMFKDVENNEDIIKSIVSDSIRDKQRNDLKRFINRIGTLPFSKIKKKDPLLIRENNVIAALRKDHHRLAKKTARVTLPEITDQCSSFNRINKVPSTLTEENLRRLAKRTARVSLHEIKAVPLPSERRKKVPSTLKEEDLHRLVESTSRVSLSEITARCPLTDIGNDVPATLRNSRMELAKRTPYPRLAERRNLDSSRENKFRRLFSSLLRFKLNQNVMRHSECHHTDDYKNLANQLNSLQINNSQHKPEEEEEEECTIPELRKMFNSMSLGL